MIDESTINNELEQIDNLLKKSTIDEYTKNYVLIRLSALLENGIKLVITRTLEQYKNKNNCNRRFNMNLSFDELKQISNKEKSIDEVYFENNQNLTNVKRINNAFEYFFGFKIFELLDFCIGKKTNYEKDLRLFVLQRNDVVHHLSNTNFSSDDLNKFKEIMLSFLDNLQFFMKSFGELIETNTRSGKISNSEKNQLKNRFLEIKKLHSSEK